MTASRFIDLLQIFLCFILYERRWYTLRQFAFGKDMCPLCMTKPDDCWAGKWAL